MAGRLRSLAVSFASTEDLRLEYDSNVSNGGIFVASEETFTIREAVQVKIEMAWANDSLCLPGEVVHVIPVELAKAGATPGVAVQFKSPTGELRELFKPFLGDAPRLEKTRGDDRRQPARRSKARVRARVRCRGHSDIEGRTRNLSTSGVLVSVTGGGIDVGEIVQVFITNPKTGEEREILGKVARHIEGEGGVLRAIGIQFYMSQSERRGVEHFLKDLTAVEHSRHLGGIQGAIEELGLINLVQTFGLAAPEGTLDVIRGAEEGYIAFERGDLLVARVGGIKGVKALARMLAWPEGHFEFHARVAPELREGEPICMDTALLDAMRLMDENIGANRRNFPPHAILSIDANRRHASAGPFTKLEDSILDLAGAGVTVQRILDTIPETDAEIYTALQGLVDAEIISIRT